MTKVTVSLHRGLPSPTVRDSLGRLPRIRQLSTPKGPSSMLRDLLEESKTFWSFWFRSIKFDENKGVWLVLFIRFEDKEVQRDMKLVPYKIVNKDGKPYIQVKIKDGETKVFSPEEISAMVLIKMKETAEAFLGKKINDAVVTVPGNWNKSWYQFCNIDCFQFILFLFLL